jgi:hypothetical protein
VVLGVGGLYPPVPDPTEQVTFPHQPQHLLVIHLQSFPLQLLSNPPVAIAWIFEADGFNLAS